jgi:hypothetical protein
VSFSFTCMKKKAWIFHIPSDLVVDRRTAYIMCSSALDFPLRHEAHAQDLL